MIVNYYIAKLRLNRPFPHLLLLNVNGVARLGKTYTLLKAYAYL